MLAAAALPVPLFFVALTNGEAAVAAVSLGDPTNAQPRPPTNRRIQLRI